MSLTTRFPNLITVDTAPWHVILKVQNKENRKTPYGIPHPGLDEVFFDAVEHCIVYNWFKFL